MNIQYQTEIANKLGWQAALVYGYIHWRLKYGAANITAYEAQDALGINYEAWLRCRSMLESYKYIKQCADDHHNLWIALPEQKFPFEPKKIRSKKE